MLVGQTNSGKSTVLRTLQAAIEMRNIWASMPEEELKKKQK
jgi:ABC-type phosphate/phosphonate transport system ATPase subunit